MFGSHRTDSQKTMAQSLATVRAIEMARLMVLRWRPGLLLRIASVTPRSPSGLPSSPPTFSFCESSWRVCPAPCGPALPSVDPPEAVWRSWRGRCPLLLNCGRHKKCHENCFLSWHGDGQVAEASALRNTRALAGSVVSHRAGGGTSLSPFVGAVRGEQRGG